MNEIFVTALTFLKKRELQWYLNKKINRRKYLKDILNRLADKNKMIELKKELRTISDNELESI